MPDTGCAYTSSALLALKTGNKLIDDEHAELFRALEKLLEAARSQPVDSATFSEIFSRIGLDLARHFDHEESLFIHSDLPDADVADHVSAHIRIVEQFSHLNIELMRGKQLMNDEVVLMAQRWILNHLISYDLKLRPFIADKPEH